METQKRTIRCKHCGYEWQTSSDKMYVTCPSCTRKTLSMDTVLQIEERDAMKDILAKQKQEEDPNGVPIRVKKYLSTVNN